MRLTLLSTFLIVLLFSCAKEDVTLNNSTSLTKSDNSSLQADETKNEEAKGEKIDVCHYDSDNDSWHLINISVNAWKGHEGHGDVRLDDQDGDGYYPDNECGVGPMGDCDDLDASINPAAEEICEDGIDQDCDGEDPSCIVGCWTDKYPDAFVIANPRFWNFNSDGGCSNRGRTIDIFICFDPACGDNFIWVEGNPGNYRCWAIGEGEGYVDGVNRFSISDAEAIEYSAGVEAVADELGISCVNSLVECSECPMVSKTE